MNKIYLGETEVANVGSSGGGSDYVLNSSFDEMTRVAASALLDLRGLEDKLDEQEQALEKQEASLLAEVHVVEQTKADVSVVYLKTDIDNADKVSAAALASLNERVSTLEASSGEQFDPTYLELEILDVSDMVELTGNLVLDVSSRVDFLESIDYVDTQTLDASLKEYTYSKERIDASLAEIASSGSGSTPSGNFLEYFEVDESGFFFVDASLNIGVSIDSSGLHAPNLVEYNEIS